MPEAEGGLARKGSAVGYLFFCGRRPNLIRHPAVEEEYEIHAYIRVKD